MPIADYTTYKALREQPPHLIHAAKASITVVASRPTSYWTGAHFAGAAPTAPVAPDRTTTGALTWAGNTFPNFTNGRIVGIRVDAGASAQASPALVTLCDRLSHQGGLSGTVVGAQTTNLPTAAITRGDTTGADVFAALEIYTAVGTTATTVTCEYTRPDGTGGRVTPAVVFGNSGFREAARMIWLPNQEGDRGFRSIQSVSLAGSTVSAAGNFGVTLFRPILTLFLPSNGILEWDPIIDNGGVCPILPNDACLFWIMNTQTAGPHMYAEISVVED